MVDNRKRIVMDQPDSEVSQKYFNIAERIKYYSGNNKKTLLFLSEQEKEGKTTIASNIAIALAKKGGNIVYLDADLESPSIHDTFNVTLRNGISDAVATDKSILSVTYDTPQYGLSTIHAGLKRSIGNELFLSNKFKYVVDTLKNKYDYIIIDAGMGMNDSACLDAIKEAVDAVVVVQSDERYTLETDNLMERLEQKNIEVLGVINNFVEG